MKHYDPIHEVRLIYAKPTMVIKWRVVAIVVAVEAVLIYELCKGLGW